MQIGIELEVIGNMSTACRAMRDLGLNVIMPGYTHRVTAEWKLVNDASVPAGFEVVSPILESTNEEHMRQVANVCAALNASGCTVNRSCGFHVHVNARSLRIENFKTLLKVFAKFEPVMDSFMPESRRNNTYARTTLSCIGVNIATNDERFPVVLQQYFQRVDRCTDVHGLFRTCLQGTRYTKLNLDSYTRHGTVEFRQHSGTTDANKVLNWIQFCVGMVERSLRPNTRVTLQGAASLDTLFKAVRRPGLKRYYRQRAEVLAGTRRRDRSNAREGA